MPKATNYPRLRTKVFKGAAGQVYVYYVYDMRPEGKPDVRLGKDHAEAIAKWDELHNKKPARVGRIQQAIDQWREQELPKYTKATTLEGYTRQLKRVEAWCGMAAWHEITVPAMRAYLKKRKAKTQGNRELAVLSIVWNYARKEGITDLPWPAAGLERSGWKNKEVPREREITDEVFDAIYARAGPVLRDAMDIASATSMRVYDVLAVVLPTDDTLRFKASKTGKRTEFSVAASPVLTEVVKRRRANMKAEHLMLLAGGVRPVTYNMLRSRFEAARAAAAALAEGELADAIRGMVLRDCRKYAADKAATAEDAQKLLQHGNVATTLRHYRTKADQAKPVR